MEVVVLFLGILWIAAFFHQNEKERNCKCDKVDVPSKEAYQAAKETLDRINEFYGEKEAQDTCKHANEG